MHGRSPYSTDGFFNPPWTAILLIPFAALPENVGRATLIVASLVSYTFIAHKLGATKVATILLLLSPPVFHNIITGNIVWLAALRFVLPPWLGLFFLMIKPQIGIATSVFILITTWNDGGVKKIALTFAPIIIISIFSIAVFGPWFLSIQENLNLIGNASLWPMSIPVGLALLVVAIRKNDIRYSMAASPCLSPYVLLHSWIGALLAIAPHKKATIVAVLGL